MTAGDRLIEHLLRRAGFGASTDDLATFGQLSYSQAVDRLVDYESIPDTVDGNIGQPGYVGTTSRGQFSPNTAPDDARQRWLFRMLHSTGRCRRRWRSSGTTTSPPDIRKSPAS